MKNIHATPAKPPAPRPPPPPAPPLRPVTLRLNGEKRRFVAAPNETLLDALRNRLGIKSPKEGCGSGDCGACTVLYDKKAVRSCLILAVEAEGHDITTLEGLSRNGLTPLQEEFLKRNVFQCGFCTAGVTLAATALLEENPSPTEAQIREALSGNLCRCTGYEPIIEAVLAAAARIRRKRE